MNTLVIGGTGTVGSGVVAELAKRGADVRVLTRSEEKVRELPEGVRGVTGDLSEPATVREIFRNADAVFLLNAVGTTEAHEGLMAVNGARAAGVKRLVYMSVQDLDKAPHLPHFGAKIPIEQAIRESEFEWTILRPNNFYQNDIWYRDAMLQHGVYPQPLGNKGLSRVDVRDIAEAAAIALTTGEHAGETYNLVGPDVLTGEQTAAAWSRALDRPVHYGGDDLDAWEQQAVTMLPSWMAYDFRLMYRHFQEQGLVAGDEDIRRQTELLGHSPRSFRDFTEQTARAWRGEGGSG